MYLFYFLILAIIVGCKDKEYSLNKTYEIRARSFNFFNSSITEYKMNVKYIRNPNKILYVYSSDMTDTLKIINNNIYYRNVILKKIDFKNIQQNNTIFTIEKYYFKSNEAHSYEMYLYINKDNGILFTEFLNSGYMTEYNTKKLNNIHKKIALRQLGFKNGKFELQFPKMDYPELKN